MGFIVIWDHCNNTLSFDNGYLDVKILPELNPSYTNEF